MTSEGTTQWSQRDAVELLRRVKKDLLIVMVSDTALHEGHYVTFNTDIMWAIATFQSVALNAPNKQWLLEVGEEVGIDTLKAVKEITKFQFDTNTQLYQKLGIGAGHGQRREVVYRHGLSMRDWIIVWSIIVLSVLLALGRL